MGDSIGVSVSFTSFWVVVVSILQESHLRIWCVLAPVLDTPFTERGSLKLHFGRTKQL